MTLGVDVSERDRLVGEIEITPEMIEAGEDAVRGFCLSEVLEEGLEPRKLATAVYCAMERQKISP